MAEDELVEVEHENIPFFQKIDMWCTMVLFGEVMLVISALSILQSNFAFALVPNELMMFSPVLLNTNATERATNPVICNPFFETYRDNYLNEDAKQIKAVRNEEYLARPEISSYVVELKAIRNSTTAMIGVDVSNICEIIPLSYDRKGCMTFAEIETKCLKEKCLDQDGFNFCWWKGFPLLKYVIYILLATYYMALIVTVLLVYDPPPAGTRYFVSPYKCGILYIISGTSALTTTALEFSFINNVARQATLLKEFPEFDPIHDAGAVICMIFNMHLAFGMIFIAVGIFSKKYPRQTKRWLIRESNFTRSLKHIKEKALQKAV